MPAHKRKPQKADAAEDNLFPEEEQQEESAEPWQKATTLAELEEELRHCDRCGVSTERTNLVFGTGNPHATFMVIGEAPGAEEDAQGVPFVGRAGQLLNKILAAIDFKREDVYIANVLKDRPPNNRKPTPEEIEACMPFLRKQIKLIQPKFILCLGLTSVEGLLGLSGGLGKLRGQVLEYEGIPVMVTYHPAALLRNPGWKRAVWEDVQKARKVHDEQIAKRH